MNRLLLILILQSFTICRACSQSFTVDDLLTLPSLSPKNIDHYMSKNGFLPGGSSMDNDIAVTRFYEKIKIKRKDTLTNGRSIDLYKKGDTRFFAFHTSSRSEYLAGQKNLIKAGFFYDNKKDLVRETSVLFQKKNITVEAMTGMEEGIPVYTFLLQKKELPDPTGIQYAEDLLRFTSHEYLVSFFGSNNVKRDFYYFSEKELKKCSVLFGNSSRQVVFIWQDEDNLRDLSCILVSDIIPTVSAVKFSGSIHNNEWMLECGIHSGMSIKDLLMLNKKDFEFYGNQSAFAFTVKPGNTGNIDFEKNRVMLGCINCSNVRLFDKLTVSAMEVAEESLPMYVYYIMIFPEK
ncbi:MAG: hypothetical protein EPN92_04510 [Chitinophagaceae bacterium]|nr:MAG: hypothetical protein EPN92_04510 [Chitinophagaceae bacterium]